MQNRFGFNDLVHIFRVIGGLSLGKTITCDCSLPLDQNVGHLLNFCMDSSVGKCAELIKFQM